MHFTGLRRGEVLALRFDDLDWLHKEILVQRFKTSTSALRKDPNLTALAQKSWYIVFGEESLPQ